MACRLCQKDAELRLSHVVPEFFYKKIYDERHRLFPRIGGKLQEGPPPQKGLRERLLCANCEKALSKHEKYVREMVFGGVEIEVCHRDGRLELAKLRYESVRLCFLSILWRMGVATGPEWKHVSLGPHEERLRTLLLGGDPGTPVDYGFFCIIPTFGNSFASDLILGPDFVRFGGGRIFRTVLGGLVCAFYVGTAPFPERLRDLLVTPEGRWVLPIIEAARIPFLMEDARRLVRARQKEIQ